MRAHNLLFWIAGQHGAESADAWELFTVFGHAGLLPKSFNAEVDRGDARTWALFCFTLWTLDQYRRPSHVANELQRDGVHAWSDLVNVTNVVDWLADVFTNWEKCMSIDHLEIDRQNKVLVCTLTNGNQKYFRNNRTARPWTVGQDLTTKPDRKATKDSMLLWHVAGYFCGHVKPQHQDESAPRGEVAPLVANGHNFKK